VNDREWLAARFEEQRPKLRQSARLHRLQRADQRWASSSTARGMPALLAGRLRISRRSMAPPPHLVVTGFKRYVRNPTHVGFLVMVLGEALLFRPDRPVVVCWGVAAAGVHWYEEPSLARRFGAAYETYRRAAPASCPRLRPWTAGERDATRGAR
jgi:hypothetical protein